MEIKTKGVYGTAMNYVDSVLITSSEHHCKYPFEVKIFENVGSVRIPTSTSVLELYFCGEYTRDNMKIFR